MTTKGKKLMFSGYLRGNSSGDTISGKYLTACSDVADQATNALVVVSSSYRGKYDAGMCPALTARYREIVVLITVERQGFFSLRPLLFEFRVSGHGPVIVG